MSDDAERDVGGADDAMAELSAIITERFGQWARMNPHFLSGDPDQAAAAGVAFMAGWLACTEWGNGR